MSTEYKKKERPGSKGRAKARADMKKKYLAKKAKKAEEKPNKKGNKPLSHSDRRAAWKKKIQDRRKAFRGKLAARAKKSGGFWSRKDKE